MQRESLLSELRRLSSRELELTLDQLEASEREQVRTLLREPEVRAAPTPSFDALAGLSQWLLRAIDRAKATDAASTRMTPAAHKALSDALGHLPAHKPESGSGDRSRGRAFAAIFGRLRRGESTP
jgi:hypothetical protein